MHEYVCTYSSHFICSTHIYTIGIIALHVHENIARHRCECIVGISIVLGVRWSVMGTLLWINTVYDVD